MSTQGAVRASVEMAWEQRWGPGRWGPGRWGPARNGAARWGPIRGRPPDDGKYLKFPIKIAVLGLVLAVAVTAVRSASASPIGPMGFSGVFTNATVSGVSNDVLTFPANTTPANTTQINDPSGDLTGAVVDTMTITLGNTTSELTLSYTSSGDTLDINFTLSGVTVTPEPFSIGGIPFYFGLISATIPVGGVQVMDTGNDPSLATTLTGDVASYFDNGGSFGLSYNGISVGSDSATIEATPSASFTVVPNSDPTPEPSVIVLTLTGAAALALQRLARQLRKTALTETDAPPDS